MSVCAALYATSDRAYFILFGVSQHSLKAEPLEWVYTPTEGKTKGKIKMCSATQLISYDSFEPLIWTI